MEDDITYAWTTEFFRERIASPPHITKGEDAAATWLYEFDESKLTETERLNVILPLIKWCVEQDLLTEDLKGELRLYFKDYKNGKLDGILADYEAKEVIDDLTACYEKVFGKG